MLIAVVTLIALAIGWWQVTTPTSGKVVVISTSATGEHRLLDGRPISLGALEAELSALKGGETPLYVAISGSSPEQPPAQPSPEVAALLTRLQLNWMSAPQVGLAAPSPPPAQGGEHVR